VTVLHIDFETRSAVDLREVGLYNYARHPTTDVWCMGYAFGEEEPRMWTPQPGAQKPFVALQPSVHQVVAHNAAFELAIWNEIMVPRYGWPPLKPEQTYCTMAQCYAMGLPGGLEDAAMAMGLHVLKDKEGRSLMLRMARRGRASKCGMRMRPTTPTCGGTSRTSSPAYTHIASRTCASSASCTSA